MKPFFSPKWLFVGAALAAVIAACQQSLVGSRLVGLVAFLFSSVVLVGVAIGPASSLKWWFAGAFAAGLGVALWLPPTVSYRAANSVRAGMTMDEVRALLGKPISEASHSSNGFPPYLYRWGYNVGATRKASCEFFFDGERRVLGGGVNERGYIAYW
ncbi:MAG: outer membrane protein assembly factor BamE [Pirellulales bacterium]